jgi:hypothetical protein
MFINIFDAVILVSVLTCLVTTECIYIISRYEEWGKQNVVFGCNAA